MVSIKNLTYFLSYFCLNKSKENYKMLDLKGKSLLITGGAGSLGKALTKYLLNQSINLERLIIFSRDEQKQFQMAQEFSAETYPQIKYIIGDVRDKYRLESAFINVDYVIHAAAMKHVHIAEQNPDECIKTNIGGAQNVVAASLKCKVERIIAVSTDKACAPVGIYGATKLTSDKLFIAANINHGENQTRFSVVRYGNVLGSIGSIVPFFLNKKTIENSLPITHPDMTRFNSSQQGAVDMIMYALEHSWGGELFVPKIPSYKITDVAEAICPDCTKPNIGIRPGEKIHEEMIAASDALNTYDLGKYFVILPKSPPWEISKFIRYFDAKKVPLGFSYNSGDNEERETVDSLRQLIKTLGD